ncbi:MAG: hypothetical protein IH961_10370 [Chloroflexi bacterium]|nr:hypothetical protein [Chloroflexota bacterium]
MRLFDYERLSREMHERGINVILAGTKPNVESRPDEKGHTTAAFLRRAIAYFKRLGVHIRRIITDPPEADQELHQLRPPGRHQGLRHHTQAHQALPASRL